MAWIRFSADFDWPPRAPEHTAYKAGMRCNVPRACRAAALAAGAGEPIEAPTRDIAERLKTEPRWTPEADG
jgi:hypothetical protein